LSEITDSQITIGDFLNKSIINVKILIKNDSKFIIKNNLI